MLLDFGALTIYSEFWSNLLAIDYSFYRPDGQYGKGQYIKNCNLTQVKDAVKVDIKIERNCDDDD
jgi:hypothetical protein